MSIWQILSIESTNDIAVIKKAYAKKLKQHHPEDDPEGYQKLREAYDEAVKLAKKQESQNHSAREQPPSDHDFFPFPFAASELMYSGSSAQPAPRLGINEQVEHFIERATAIYMDFRSRIDTSKWAELLNSDIIWNIKHKQMVGHRVYRFLQEHRLMPRNVWLLIENCFHWKKESDDQEPDEFMRYYLRQLDSPGLRFDYIDPHLDLEDIDDFLYRRDAACKALQENELDLARQYVEEASCIFPKDPDLLHLHGELYVRLGKWDEALEAYARVILLLPSELDGFIGRARILHRLGRHEESIQDCEAALSLKPQHMEIQCLLGKSLLSVGEFDRSLAIFEKLKASHPHDMEIASIIEQLNRQKDNPNRRRLPPFILSPSRRYRLKPSKGFVLFLALFALIAILSSDLVFNPYKPTVTLTSPKELLQQNHMGEYVNVPLTNLKSTDFIVYHGMLFHASLDNILNIRDQYGPLPIDLSQEIGVGKLRDTLLLVNYYKGQHPVFQNEEQLVSGKVVQLVMPPSEFGMDAKIEEMFGSGSSIHEVFIDTTANRPRTVLSVFVGVIRFFLIVIYLYYFGRRFLRKLYRMTR